MLAGDLELTTLVLDLQEQPRVLDGQRRLRGEGAEEPHHLGLELAGPLARHGEHADNLVLAQQWHTEQGTMPRLDQRPPDGTLVDALDGDVVDLARLPPL